MIIDLKKVKIFLSPGFTDMRKQINSLSAIASEKVKENIFRQNIFLFCSKNRKHLKILYWDRNGFCLWWKRLERDKFPWPRNKKEATLLSYDELKMLLNGIDFFKVHQKLDYKKVS